jgi:hypothetical protein
VAYNEENTFWGCFLSNNESRCLSVSLLTIRERHERGLFPNSEFLSPLRAAAAEQILSCACLCPCTKPVCLHSLSFFGLICLWHVLFIPRTKKNSTCQYKKNPVKLFPQDIHRKFTVRFSWKFFVRGYNGQYVLMIIHLHTCTPWVQWLIRKKFGTKLSQRSSY